MNLPPGVAMLGEIFYLRYPIYYTILFYSIYLSIRAPTLGILKSSSDVGGRSRIVTGQKGEEIK